jgi:hypothetical protein
VAINEFFHGLAAVATSQLDIRQQQTEALV